jgi:hypothetical protein
MACAAALALMQASCEGEHGASTPLGPDAGSADSPGPDPVRADAGASGNGADAERSAPRTEGGTGSNEQSGDAGEEAPDHPTLSFAERRGDLVEVHFANTSNAFALQCNIGTELLKSTGQSWSDATPGCGAGAYYLDGEYRDNPSGAAGCCNGGSSCIPFADTQTFLAADRVRTGARAAPDAGRRSDAGADAGAELTLPVIETRPEPGPYQLVIRYYEDAECTVGLYELDPIDVELPLADG